MSVTTPGLLVSVRSAFESREALAGGADVIDVKDPELGSLGAASAETIAAVVRAVGGSTPVTAALGELQDAGGSAAFRPVPGVTLYKLGLSGVEGSSWRAALLEWRDAVRRSSQNAADLVAVAYADGRSCGAPSIDAVFELALSEHFPAVLVDTHEKTGSTLVDAWSLADLERWSERARARGVRVVAAGSLRCEQIADVVAAGVDLIAVRGAATVGERVDAIGRAPVARLRAAVLAACASGAAGSARSTQDGRSASV